MGVTVDGVPYVPNERFVYKGCMLSDVPNFAFCRGYFAQSWTLKTDIVGKYVCRILNHMLETGTKVVTPRLPPEGVGEEPAMTVNAAYVVRSKHTYTKFGS